MKERRPAKWLQNLILSDLRNARWKGMESQLGNIGDDVGVVDDGGSYAPTSPISSPLPSSLGEPEDVGNLEDVEKSEHGQFEGTGAMIATGREVSEIIGSLKGDQVQLLPSSSMPWRLVG